ncbi:MAG TPA: GPW/gp25 family protein [Candidatus Gastranaerophilales bacterium]|nr:GPW/gp25 family protein [Candidatus Gastranaerophilales bacterium]
MTTLKDIKYADWQPELNKIGSVVEGIDDINQCIAIILTTRKGSVPHRPEFGCDIWKFIDNPVNIAIPNIIREATDAINQWETRIEIESITATINESQVKLQITWIFKNTDITETAEVIL